MQKIANLILEGGGVGAIAYAGFLKKAQEQNSIDLHQLERVAGVSSGAIAATQLALNYTPDEILLSLKNTDFAKFTQEADRPEDLQVFTEQGLYNKDYLYNYIGALIEAKTQNPYITFAELHALRENFHYKDVYVVATKIFMINSQPEAYEFTFSYEHTPGAKIIDAVRASAAIPFIFAPVRLLRNDKGQYIIHAEGDVFVDGGVLNTYPIRIFDRARYLSNPLTDTTPHTIIYNPESMGLRLASHIDMTTLHHMQEQPILTDFQYANALFFIMRNRRHHNNLDNMYDLKRSIVIDTLGISSTQFDLSDQDKWALLKSGEDAALRLNNPA